MKLPFIQSSGKGKLSKRKDLKPEDGDVKCGDNGAEVVITSLRIQMVPKLDNSSLSS